MQFVTYWLLSVLVAIPSHPNVHSAVDGVEDVPLCEEAREWVSDNHADLPATLDELAEFGPVYRRVIYNALPAASKRSLWRTRLQKHLKDNEELGRRERLTIRSVIRSLPTLIGEDRDDPAARRAFEEVETRVLDVFGADRGTMVFASLGLGGSETAGGMTCTCTQDATFSCNSITGPETVCQSRSCIDSEAGCGLLFLQPCNGVCSIKPAIQPCSGCD